MLQVDIGVNMTKLLINEIIENINKILNSYDKLHEFEKKDCSHEQIRKELLTLRNSTERLASLIPKFNQKVVQTTDLADVFKITYFPTLKIHLMYLSENQESKHNLLKIQARIAITYLNVDGGMDKLKTLRDHLKN
ncbi:MAG: hypothetical protein KGL95_07130 [Patescibacteria group bacterium]|nr:hypothetical protein [Patescibacteria group bacterium]